MSYWVIFSNAFLKFELNQRTFYYKQKVSISTQSSKFLSYIYFRMLSFWGSSRLRLEMINSGLKMISGYIFCDFGKIWAFINCGFRSYSFHIIKQQALRILCSVEEILWRQNLFSSMISPVHQKLKAQKCIKCLHELNWK